eukprot:NODE_280_length_1021_cov_509.109620_g273_i0.p1 GENE.NODE_280_length_1021_cov_509.109620_g273_i0~~NODE_280_length_1021_cov_509.109620_g273_i0.p1  ORF type:complete len:281 (-),score=87.55 NODE_280_length_1021_cov_509.109620_g273_i0:179-973(-)
MDGTSCTLNCANRTQEVCEWDLLCVWTDADAGACAAPTGGNALWVRPGVQAYDTTPPEDKKMINVHIANLVPDLAIGTDGKPSWLKVALTGGSSAETTTALVRMTGVAGTVLMDTTLVGDNDVPPNSFGPAGNSVIGVHPIAFAIPKETYKVTYSTCDDAAGDCLGVNATFTPVADLDGKEIDPKDLKEGESMLIEASGSVALGGDYAVKMSVVEDAQGKQSAWHKPWPYIIIGIGVIVLLAVCGYFVYKRQQPKDEEHKPLLG